MPWGMVQEPPLGPAILASSLRNAGLTCAVRHCHLQLLRYLKHDSYSRLADVFALNDFVFTKVLSDSTDHQQEECLKRICNDLWEGNPAWNRDPRFSSPIDICDYLTVLREEVIPDYLESLVESIIEDSPALVGFSCLYDQTIPSLALAHSLREAGSSALFAYGGYALRGPLAANLPASNPDIVDVVVEGAGEEAIVSLTKFALGGIQPQGSEFHWRPDLKDKKSFFASSKVNIQQSPLPDYSDYSRDLLDLRESWEIEVAWKVIPYETSRGCWWGQKSHCIFCGIAPEDLVYSFKAEDRVLEEVNQLHRTYGRNTIRFVDYILPFAYYRTLLPKLARSHSDLMFTCEMKANVTISQMDALAAARFVEVQPGIESFVDSTLKGMRKGVRALQNIAVLKMGFSRGIIVHYNILYGFPFDSAEDYRRMLNVLPKIRHLQPPATVVNVLTTRFSPMQRNPSCGEKAASVPHSYYSVIFSQDYLAKTGFALGDYCYYFEPVDSAADGMEPLYQELIREMQKWNDSYFYERSSFLVHETGDDGLITFFDSRGDKFVTHQATRDVSEVYSSIGEHLFSVKKLETDSADPTHIHAALQWLEDRGLIIMDGGQLIGLSVPRSSIRDNRVLEMPSIIELQNERWNELLENRSKRIESAKAEQDVTHQRATRVSAL